MAGGRWSSYECASALGLGRRCHPWGYRRAYANPRGARLQLLGLGGRYIRRGRRVTIVCGSAPFDATPRAGGRYSIIRRGRAILLPAECAEPGDCFLEAFTQLRFRLPTKLFFGKANVWAATGRIVDR